VIRKRVIIAIGRGGGLYLSRDIKSLDLSSFIPTQKLVVFNHIRMSMTCVMEVL